MDRKKLTMFLILLVCLPMMSTDIITPILPSLSRHFDATISETNLIFTYYMIGYSLSMLIGGALSDMLGRRKVLLLSLWIYCIASFLIMLCNSLYIFILLRFFQGLGGGSGTVIGRLIVKDYYDEKNQVDMLINLSLWMAISPGLAPQIGAILSNLFNWHAIFCIIFILGSYILYLTYSFLIETKSSDQTQTINPLLSFPRSFIQVFLNKKFLGYMLLISFTWCIYFTFLSLSSFIFQHQFQFSENYYALLIGFITLWYLLSSLFAKRLNRKQINLDKLILIGIVLCSIPMLLFISAWYYKISYFMILSILLIRTGIAFLMPSAQAAAMQVASHSNIGWSMGCLFFMEFLLGSIFVYFAGIFEDIYLGLGMVLIMVFSSIMLWIGLLFTVNTISHKFSLLRRG